MTTAGTQTCLDCDGLGRTRDVEVEDDGAVYVTVTCCLCEGSGDLVDCRHCGEPTAAPEVERQSGMCLACHEDADVYDADEARRCG